MRACSHDHIKQIEKNKAQLDIDPTPLQEEERSKTKENGCSKTDGDVLGVMREIETCLDKRLGLLGNTTNHFAATLPT